MLCSERAILLAAALLLSNVCFVAAAGLLYRPGSACLAGLRKRMQLRAPFPSGEVQRSASKMPCLPFQNVSHPSPAQIFGVPGPNSVWLAPLPWPGCEASPWPWLTEAVLEDRRWARAAALLFCLSPASVFLSAAYTESCYTMLGCAPGLSVARWTVHVPLAPNPPSVQGPFKPKFRPIRHNF